MQRGFNVSPTRMSKTPEGEGTVHRGIEALALGRRCRCHGKPLQLGDLDGVVDLIPTVHDQIAGHRIQGVELTAGVSGLEDRDVVGTGGNCMGEARDGGIAGTGGVHRRDVRSLGAERAAIAEADGTDSAHGDDDPWDVDETLVLSESGAQGIDVVVR